MASLRVLVLDDYDSSTHNLVQCVSELGAEIEVVRNDHAMVAELLLRGYDRVIVSPGPCTPDQAGITLAFEHPWPGIEYPRNWHELLAWFPDDAACLR